MGGLPAFKRQHLLAEFTGLKQACPQGIFVSLTPGDPTLWSGVLFVRKGPYAPAILRFYLSFPDTYPSLPPLVTFATDIFHPLLTPLSTYMYSTDVRDGATASASDDERLPPGGFSLRHGFPGWFGRGSRAAASPAGVGVGVGESVVAVNVVDAEAGGGVGLGLGLGLGGADEDGDGDGDGARGRVRVDDGLGLGGDQGEMELMTPTRAVATATGTTAASAASATSSSASAPGYARPGGMREVSTYEVLRYIRSTFDDEDVLDSVPLEAAGNPGAWHAWRTHRRQAVSKPLPVPGGPEATEEGEVRAEKAPAPVAAGPAATTRRPGEWNWEGVWEERVKRGIAASLSEGVLYGQAGTADDVINFLSMDDTEVEGAKSNLLRTLGAAA